jgi:dipeptidyl aminopeptidase/acylaminoacyl peptidase
LRSDLPGRWTKSFLFAFVCILAVLFAVPATLAQNLDKPLHNIDEDVTAFAIAPDGRIVYSVRRTLKTKLYELSRDDIWIQDAGGKRRRIFEGPKYTRGTQTFSYIIDSFQWSPNGRYFLARLLTTTVVEDSGKSEDSLQTLLYDESGHELRIDKGGNLILDSASAQWLTDNNTIAYLSETLKPQILSALKFTRLSTGPLTSVYQGRTFRDLALIPRMNFAIAVEQDHAQSGPPRLQHMDMFNDEDKELATLDGYETGLSVSPSGRKVAYFIDRETLEIREIASPTHLARIRIGLGTYRWTPDETRILLKRAPQKKSGYFVSVQIPQLAGVLPGSEIPVTEPPFTQLFHGLTIRDFDVSSDGQYLGIVSPGKRNLLVFSVTR